MKYIISIILILTQFDIFSQPIEISDKNLFDFRLEKYKDSLYIYTFDSIMNIGKFNSKFNQVTKKQFVSLYGDISKFIYKDIHPYEFYYYKQFIQKGACTCAGYDEVEYFFVKYKKPTQKLKFKPLETKASKDIIVNKRKIEKYSLIPVKSPKIYISEENTNIDLLLTKLSTQSLREKEIFNNFTASGLPKYDKTSGKWVNIEEGYLDIFVKN